MFPSHDQEMKITSRDQIDETIIPYSNCNMRKDKMKEIMKSTNCFKTWLTASQWLEFYNGLYVTSTKLGRSRR